jgi:proline dehydrogenase
VLSQKALLLGASRRSELRRLVTGTPVTRRVVDRFVAGASLDAACAAASAS